MISSAIEANPGVPGFLFDGFPRTTAQAAALDMLLAEHGSEIGVLIALQVPEEELIARMLNRAKTSGRSDDADEHVQRNRLAVYRRDTLPVSDHYAQFGKSLSIEGVGGIEEIFGRICQVIDERSSQAS
jgi:adenylate kinase